MNILDTIVEHKRVEVLNRKESSPLPALRESPFYGRRTNDLSLKGSEAKPGIIAEFKRKSPSRGMIRLKAEPVEVAAGYETAGVAAMSILTDSDFFGGSLEDMRQVRTLCPGLVLLRKDFIIDPYQLHEASACGADMVLLIAAILDAGEVRDLAREAASLGLQILFEVHSADELGMYQPEIRYVGVNNRDLKNFSVDTARSLELIKEMPDGIVPVSESGLSDPGEVRRLHAAGYRLFLIGETFMKEDDPGAACRRFMDQL